MKKAEQEREENMARSYITHNEISKYWRIECISKPLTNASGHFIFKGKTLEGAIKAAKKYCKKYTELHFEKYGQSMEMGKVLYECDYYGRKVNA